MGEDDTRVVPLAAPLVRMTVRANRLGGETRCADEHLGHVVVRVGSPASNGREVHRTDRCGEKLRRVVGAYLVAGHTGLQDAEQFAVRPLRARIAEFRCRHILLELSGGEMVETSLTGTDVGNPGTIGLVS